MQRSPSYRPKCLTCDRSRKSNQLMCPRCWTLVPAAVQTEIRRTWQPNSIRQSDAWTAAVGRAQAVVRAALTPSAVEP